MSTKGEKGVRIVSSLVVDVIDSSWTVCGATVYENAKGDTRVKESRIAQFCVEVSHEDSMCVWFSYL